MAEEFEEFYTFDPVPIEVQDFETDGFILDIGGGGEGVIGRLKGSAAVAIDLRKDELEEAAAGPLKIIMDARDLQFLDASFSAATAFFALMYFKTREDQRRALQEAFRVLKPGGRLHLWEINLPEKPETHKEFYLVFIRYRVGDYEMGTGYGQRWPQEPRGMDDYIRLAEDAGFVLETSQRNQHTFMLVLRKPDDA